MACLTLPSLLQADTVSDLRSALQALKGQTPLSLHVERSTWKRVSGKDQSEHDAFQLEDGPKGLRRTDGKSFGEEDTKPENWARAHREMLDLLSMTSVLDEKPDTLDGRPVRRLHVGLLGDKGTPSEASEKGKLDKFVLEATFWIGPDNLPLAVDKHVEVAGRAGFFLKYSSHVQDHRRYLKVKDRLVLVEATREAQVNGLGQDTLIREVLHGTVQ